MSCERYESLIGDLVDGTLDGAPRHELEAHLATCATCTRLAEELLVVRRAARGLPPMELPPTAWARVSAAVEAERAAHPTPKRPPRPGSPRSMGSDPWEETTMRPANGSM